jgi:predicted kinase
MNMEIIMPIGISGSGKTRLYNMRYSDLTLVSPDLIRKELTGSISDQKKNKEVFEEVDRRVADLVKKGESFFYDATNVNPEFRKKFVEQFRGTDVKIIYVVLPADLALSYKRIKDDLKNRVERSDVPHHALIRQLGMYNHSLKSNFEGENVQKIVYIKPGELD